MRHGAADARGRLLPARLASESECVEVPTFRHEVFAKHGLTVLVGLTTTNPTLVLFCTIERVRLWRPMKGNYHCEARSIDAFVAQVVRYVSAGYYFYVRVRIPDHKDPRQVDRKIIDLYGVDQPRWRRERRHLKQSAAVHYLRCDRLFVLMLTKGRHDRFYADHGAQVQDIRRAGLKAFGYSIRFTFSQTEKRHKVFVRLDQPIYRKLRSHLLTVCTWNSHRSAERVEREFRRLPWQPYAPVYQQLLSIAKSVNRSRRRAGFAPIDFACIPSRIRVSTTFAA